MKGLCWTLPAMLLVLQGCEPAPPANPGNPFELVRLDNLANPLPATPAPGQSWSCVLDRRTSLMWEVKSPELGLQYGGNTYSWHAPDAKHQELDYRGLIDGGKCSGSICDTAGYVAAVNRKGLCGYRDWRMPHKHELGSISDPRRPLKLPTTDIRYFPYTHTGEYWSGNDYSMQHNAAWAWGFDYAQDRVDWKRTAKFVRLVRGEAKEVKEVE